MLTQEQICHFQTLGFVMCKGLLSQEEIQVLSDAFDAAMEKARGGAPKPNPGEPRQQVVPFFDYDHDTFYPLLDNARIADTLEQLMGDDFILTVSEGILHTGGSGWHHDACAPEGLLFGPTWLRGRLSQRYSGKPYKGISRIDCSEY